MKVGLVIGKFMPLHRGHEYLIEFAKLHCDKVIVLVCANESEPITPCIRFKLISDYYEADSQVKIERFEKDMPDAAYSSREISKVWADVLKKDYPQVDAIIGSEKYVEYVAEYMDVRAIMCDEQRKVVPVSATMIRNDPHKYWDYISDAFKPYYIKKVCIFGPESCGKSTLTKLLAKHFETAFVPEMARYMIDNGIIGMDDLKIKHLDQFAKIQTAMVESMTNFANKLLYCDTDILTTEIFSEEYFGRISNIMCNEESKQKYDLYLLLTPDVPWKDDRQRNLGHKRWEMYDKCIQILQKHKLPYVVINGDWDERLRQAIGAVNYI